MQKNKIFQVNNKPHISIELPNSIMNVLLHISHCGGKPFVVGGLIRDAVIESELGIKSKSKDIDIEVFGVEWNALRNILLTFSNNVNEVGDSFGVLKFVSFDGVEVDFSLPRRENKIGKGHKGFQAALDPNMTQKDAAGRRDFTMNSLAWNPFTEEIIDPFNGLEDIRNRILRPTSSHFSEDALRLLRGMQFAARFDMKLADDFQSALFCIRAGNEFKELKRERVFEEWEKWALRSIKPSAGLRFLLDSGAIEFFPQIARMLPIEQDPEWHPEGRVFEHVCEVVDAQAEQCVRDGIDGERRLKLMMAALCHDFGKVSTTVFKDGRWRAPAHDVEGEKPTREFLELAGFVVPEQKSVNQFVEDVVALVVCHMRHISFGGSRREVRRLALAVNIKDLAQIVESDHSGRPPLPKGLPENMKKILELAEGLAIEDEKPQPILQGRHLVAGVDCVIQTPMKQGKAIGEFLKRAFEAQIEGEFETFEGAAAWAIKNL